jgi:hypothetical protein
MSGSGLESNASPAALYWWQQIDPAHLAAELMHWHQGSIAPEKAFEQL